MHYTRFRSLLPLLVTAFLLLLLAVALDQAPFAQAADDLISTPAASAPAFAAAEPLPGGCKDGLPPDQDEPVCCLSGMVETEGTPVVGAAVSIRDAQGEIGKVYTKPSPHRNEPPRYYVDLTQLKIRVLGQTRPITPTDVITLVASYNGIVGDPIRHVVQRGGQNLNLNPYNSDVLTLQAENNGTADSGRFQGIGAVDADSLGNLYLWDTRNVRMQVLGVDGQWRKLPAWQRVTGPGEDQVYTIHSIAINRNYTMPGQSSDHVYMADPYNNRIVMYTTDGDFTQVTIPITGFVSSLGFDNAGNLYAYTRNQGLKKFNQAGVLIKQYNSEILKYDTNFDQIAVAPTGDVYFVKTVANGIYKFDQNLQPVVPFTLQTSAGLTLKRPNALVVDESNTLYIYDHDTHQLYAFDDDGHQLDRAWSAPPFPTGHSFSSGSEVLLAHAGPYLYLISDYDGLIVQLSKQGGAPINTWGGQTNNHGSIANPSDLAVAPDQSIFIADIWAQRITQQVDNQVRASWSMMELGHLTDTVPLALTFDRNGKLLVTTNRQTVQRFRYEHDGFNSKLVSETSPWGSSGAELGQFCSPDGIDSDRRGIIFVTDSCNNRVQALREEPSTNSFVPITSIALITATGALSNPFGIAVDDRGDQTLIYVGDVGNERIVKLGFDGSNFRFLGIIRSTNRALQFGTTRQIAIDANGWLWVTDPSYRVHSLNPADVTQWRVYGENLIPAWNANAIDFALGADQRTLIHIGAGNFGLISSFTSLTESAPIATIVHLSAEDLEPGESLTAVGAGQDGDATNEIGWYEWSTDSGLLIGTHDAQAVIPTGLGSTQANKLGPGLHTLRLRVLDNDQPANWSAPVTRTIYVAWQAAEMPVTPIPTLDPTKTPPPPPATCLRGGLWTMLLYLDADNSRDGAQLLKSFDQSLAALQGLNHPCVQVAVQIDGHPFASRAATERWLIRPNPGHEKPTTTAGWFDINGVQVSTTEVEMDQANQLSDFIRWGQRNLPADHYYLAIADHGNGYQGIAYDHTSPNGEGWNAYLKASDLRAALTAPGVYPIDILHLDACSMALLDVAYELRGQVDYLIAAQYIGWSYFAYADYARYITQQSKAADLARLIVDRYGNLAEGDNLPYTLAALNLARIEAVKNAVDALAVPLKAWLNRDTSAQVHQAWFFANIRNQSQFFDSNTNYLNTPRDAYVDLKDFAERVRDASLPQEIKGTAATLLNELNRTDGLILWKRQSKPVPLPQRYWREGQNSYAQPINLNRANGISLYYPAEGKLLPTLGEDERLTAAAVGQPLGDTTVLTYTKVYSDYVHGKLFDLTTVSRWDEFLLAAYGAPPVGVTLAPAALPAAPLDPKEPTPTATPSPTATPTPTATPSATPTATNDPSQILVQIDEQWQDTDNSGAPSAGDVAQFDTMIMNRRAVTLSNVSLVQLLTPLTETTVMAAKAPCPILTTPHVCTVVGNIGPQMDKSAAFSITLLTSNPLPPLRLFVDGVEQGFTIVPPNQVYLPIISK